MYAFHLSDHLWWMSDCGIPVIRATRLHGRWPEGKHWHAYDPVRNEVYGSNGHKLSWTPTYTHLRAMLLWCKDLDPPAQEWILQHMGPEPNVSKHPLLWPVWYPGPPGQQTRAWPALEQRHQYQWNAEESRFVKIR